MVYNFCVFRWKIDTPVRKDGTTPATWKKYKLVFLRVYLYINSQIDRVGLYKMFIFLMIFFGLYACVNVCSTYAKLPNINPALTYVEGLTGGKKGWQIYAGAHMITTNFNSNLIASLLHALLCVPFQWNPSILVFSSSKSSNKERKTQMKASREVKHAH